MHSPENSYISNIDTGSTEKHELPPDIGFLAEDVVSDFFNKNFEGINVRPATESEDSGTKQIVSGKQIDAVAYMDGHAAMCMQITTARDQKVIKEKMRQLAEKPFVRLDSMDAKDSAIPKVFIGLNPEEVSAFLKDHDFSAHPQITEKIIHDTLASLKFDLTQTKDKTEQDKIKKLIAFFGADNGVVH